jgi:hypothetical protein
MFVRDSCSKQLDSDRLAADVPQFSSRPSLVRSVTVVLLSLVTGGKGGEGRLVKPGAGLIQPLCRRDGHSRPGCQGGKPPWGPGSLTRRDLPNGHRGEGEPFQHETS